jgi:TRAP-type C4-dicarboxylate transport system substrate-binding protein
MRRFLPALLALFSTSALAQQPVELRFAFPAPPTSFFNTQVFTPWAKEVEAASNGTLTIRIVPGLVLATQENVYDRVLKGIADIGFGLQEAVGGQFTRSSVVSLPFEFESPRESSPAMWRLHQTGVIAEDYREVRPLALFTFGHAAIHTTRARIKSLNDIKGLKLRAGGKFQSDIVAALGAAPVTMTPPDVFQSLSSGVIDGTSIQWTAVLTFKLNEVARNHFMMPLDSSPGMLFMNKASYDRLPAAGKAAIDKYSGESLSRRTGIAIAEFDESAQERFRKDPTQNFDTVGPEEKARWQKQLQGITDGWVKTTPNGNSILAAWRAEIKKVRAGQ